MKWLFYFGAFLLVDWVAKFELEFLLVLCFPTANRKNTYVKSRFICTRGNLDALSVYSSL